MTWLLIPALFQTSIISSASHFNILSYSVPSGQPHETVARTKWGTGKQEWIRPSLPGRSSHIPWERQRCGEMEMIKCDGWKRAWGTLLENSEEEWFTLPGGVPQRRYHFYLSLKGWVGVSKTTRKEEIGDGVGKVDLWRTFHIRLWSLGNRWQKKYMLIACS